MDKQVDARNQIWFAKNGEVTNIGFTRSFIQAAMDECWFILPAAQKTREKEPLLMLETNEGIISILSPCDGDVLSFSDRARDFPDQLQEEDVVISLGVSKKVPKKQVQQNEARINWPNGEMAINWDDPWERVLRQEQELREEILRHERLERERRVLAQGLQAQAMRDFQFAPRQQQQPPRQPAAPRPQNPRNRGPR